MPAGSKTELKILHSRLTVHLSRLGRFETRALTYTAISRKFVGKKGTKVHATRPKGSMGRGIQLLHVLHTNEI